MDITRSSVRGGGRSVKSFPGTTNSFLMPEKHPSHCVLLYLARNSECMGVRINIISPSHARNP